MLWIREKSKKNRGGFTLIEIMIVVLIIAILLAVAIPNFMRARESSRAKSCQGNLRQIETAKEQWAMDNKKSATDTPAKEDLVTEYIKSATDNTLPLCPSSGVYDIGNMETRPSCGIGAQADGSVAPNDYNDHLLK